MRPAHLSIAPLALALIALAACGGNTEDNQVTETRMDDVDSLKGTISDDAINLDVSTDEAPIEAAPTPSEMPKFKLDKTQAKETGGPDQAEITADDASAE